MSRAIAYYVNWAIYARDHQPQSLPAAHLTHALYAFANTSPETGTVSLTDAWSDVEKHYPTDSWNDTGTNLYGCLKQLALHKRRNRNFKTLLSIGGWTYSGNFRGATATAEKRRAFAASAVGLVRDCGFDGIDVDWEYPGNEGEAQQYVQLLAEIRGELDAYAASVGIHKGKLLVSVACPAGRVNFEKLKIAEMDRYLDFWNLMAYDYAGSWDSSAGHQANVHPSQKNPISTPFNTVDAIKHYTSKGVAPAKIVLGCPLYGRAFVGTKGPGTPYTGGVGPGSWENGVWDWKALPLSKEGGGKHEVFRDADLVASWSYDAQSGTMVSFDDLTTQVAKADWADKQGLGGVMWWDSSGDKPVGEGGVIGAVFDTLRKSRAGIEKRENVINYPLSKYDNLRKGFPGEA